MKQQTHCQIKITVDNQATSGEVQIQYFSQKERTTRALKSLGFCWGLAVVSIIIPIAHFILVPGFFIAGIFVPFQIYYREGMILGGKGSCPKCKAPLVIKRGSYKWPLTEICQTCGVDLQITQVEINR